jgi:putative tryptophan/tyrosine transport system substrate-binding protein
MRRRDFITLLAGAAAAWPVTARPQQGERVRRIGVLMSLPENDPESSVRIAALQQELQNQGWIEGRNVRFDYRFTSGDPVSMRTYAAELVKVAPDVIVGSSAAVVVALRQETGTVPIVFVLVPDPVASGLVESIARPGGNLTGFASNQLSMGSKWLELLKEIVPDIKQFAVLYNPSTAAFSGYVRSLETAAASFGLGLIPAPVRSDAEIELAISALDQQPHSGCVVLPDAFTAANRDMIVSLAAKHRVPAIYPYRYFATDGGLMSYGVDTVDLFRRAASYVDRILKGEKPADLPVQLPNKFDFVINVKAAEALGLAVPESFLIRADEVIE